MALSKFLTAGGSKYFALSPTPEPGDSPAPFMKLPRELRDMVYHEIWKDENGRSLVARARASVVGTPVTGIGVQYDTGWHYPQRCTKSLKRHLPTWLLTSRWFLEGLAQLLSNSTWNLVCVLPHNMKSSLPIALETEMSTNPLFSLKYVQCVTIDSSVHPPYFKEPDWLHLVANSMDQDNHIKVLHVNLDARALFPDRCEMVTKWLRAFEALLAECKKLKTLTLRVMWLTKAARDPSASVVMEEQVYRDCRNTVGSVFKIDPDVFTELPLTDADKRLLSYFRAHSNKELEIRVLTYTIR